MFSKTSTQTIKALVELAKLPTGVCQGAKVIAREINAPANYLGKLLQGLSLKGLVVSQKGFHGGFRLGKDPQDITLLDVVSSVESVNRLSECAFGLGQCGDSLFCPIHSRLESIRKSYLAFLMNTTIKDLIDQNNHKKMMRV